MPRPQHKSQTRLGQWTPSFRSRWQDRNYTMGLTWDEKAMLEQLRSFDVLSRCGVVRADNDILAQKHPDREPEDIEGYIKALVEKDCIVRSGSEIFVRDAFITQPTMLRTPNALKTMVTAINQVGYDDLRETVIAALFSALEDIAELDKKATAQEIKEICTELAEHHEVRIPESLRYTARGRPRKITETEDRSA